MRFLLIEFGREEQKNQFSVPSHDSLVLASEMRRSTHDRLDAQIGQGQLLGPPPTFTTPLYRGDRQTVNVLIPRAFAMTGTHGPFLGEPDG